MSRRRKHSIIDLMVEYMEDFKIWAEERIESAIAQRPSWNTRACCLEPLCNVFVAIDEVVVTADLPNTNPESVKVKAASEDLIEIRADMKRKMRFDDFGITHRKGEFSSFRCQVRIPVPVDTKRMQIDFKRGILEIRLPRKKDYATKVE
ncbi:MAG: Hsp20/alpha crystallin family protein [Candidatus Bathyarchaeota archaeon]|nr:MAG: Hsp20/alpha crystallin family protein [Candidatus Bathyarchaeota archaeon]